MVEFNFERLPNENEEQFIWRLGQAKDSGELDMDWIDIADIINKEFRSDDSEYRTESAYRKCFQQAKRFYESGVFKGLTSQQYVADILEQQRELRKIKQQLSDERVDYQRTIREQARRESLVELVERVMTKYIEPFEYKPSPDISSEDDMIVCLSDLHTGIEINNFWNKYDTTILRNRLHNYLDQIRSAQNTHKCEFCEVVLAGDFISGLIHPNLRLENNENVILQTKIAITYIGEFIGSLREMFKYVRVHSVAGNHSRLSPNKDDHEKGENLDELVPFCLHLMFDKNDNIQICEDGYIDESINSFKTRGDKLFYVVHGDKDTLASVLKNLTVMTGMKPDGIIMAHRHHNAYDTQYKTKIIQAGCVVGTDNHCVDSRISGEPEQILAITNSKRTVKCLYDIGLE